MFSSNATQVSAVTQAEAVDFDGTNDYLSRSSDLTGNTNGQAFTFSAWLWKKADGTLFALYDSDNSGFFGIRIQLDASNQITIQANNASNTLILSATATSPLLGAIQTFVNVLVSIDLSSASNRAVYVNDVAATVTWTTYTNQTIGRIRNRHGVGNAQGGDRYAGRLSNVFLDYTYRNMSVTANRRLFITADLKPAAGQAALNPILYLAMSDPTTVGTNTGTGGNFTLTGTVARSGRGPNQYNAPYSDLDGAADYLSRTTAPSGIADSGVFTLGFSYQPDVIGGTAQAIICFSSSSSVRFDFYVDTDGSAYLRGYDTTSTTILQAIFAAATFVAGRNYVVTCSIDLSNSAKRHIYINGQSASPTWTNYTSGNINFNIATTPRYRVAANQTPSSYVNGKLGALWFNTSYIDLSVASNLAKFVSGTGINAKPVDLGANGELPTGTSPLIYLPMYGNNAGKNYGTGGDFTVNSGPYTGSRGPNEFWGNKAAFDGSTGYLRTATTTGAADSKTVSGSFWIRFNATPTGNQFPIYGATASGGSRGFRVLLNSTPNLRFLGTSNLGANVLDVTVALTLVANTDYYVQFCFDLTDSAKRFVYINNVSRTLTINTYSNTDIAHSEMTPMFGAGPAGASSAQLFFNGSLSETYIHTDYIDFSQEANRLKFRDAFGNPTDLPLAITALSVPNPIIYMRFDPASQGTNSGTGGNLTKYGTITDGGQL